MGNSPEASGIMPDQASCRINRPPQSFQATQLVADPKIVTIL
jgi:hypothetical protein